MILSDFDPLFLGMISWGVPNIIAAIRGDVGRLTAIMGLPLVFIGVLMLFSSHKQNARLERETLNKCAEVESHDQR